MILLHLVFSVSHNTPLLSPGLGERLRERPPPPVDRPDFRPPPTRPRRLGERQHLPSVLLPSEAAEEPGRSRHQEHRAGIRQQLWSNAQAGATAGVLFKLPLGRAVAVNHRPLQSSLCPAAFHQATSTPQWLQERELATVPACAVFPQTGQTQDAHTAIQRYSPI